MRKWPLSLAIALLAPVAWAADKTHDVTGTFISADSKGKVMTMKLEDGTSSTGKVDGNARKQLDGLKYGDKIVVTCKDDEQGNHVAAVDIQRAD